MQMCELINHKIFESIKILGRSLSTIVFSGFDVFV